MRSSCSFDNRPERDAPKNAATTAPPMSASIAGRKEPSGASERVRARMNSEGVIVVKLTARLSGTAFRAGYARRPASTGKRNSAPPRPINPPRIAIGIAVRKARRERPRTARSAPCAVSDDFIRLCPFHNSDAALSETGLILSKQLQRRQQECNNLSAQGFTLSQTFIFRNKAD